MNEYTFWISFEMYSTYEKYLPEWQYLKTKALLVEERNIKNNSLVFSVCTYLSMFILIWKDFF